MKKTKPFSSDTGTLLTDGQTYTDIRTDGQIYYINIILRVGMLTRDKKWTDFDANWHKWQGHETVKFVHQEVKGQGHIELCSFCSWNNLALQVVLPRDAINSAAYAVARRLFVCPSVCLSVTRRYSVETVIRILKLFTAWGNHTILVFVS